MDATAQSSTNLMRNVAFVGLGLAALFGASTTAVGASIGTQLAYEVAHCTANKAKLFGFIGACCNWFLGLSALYDATQNGPENIALPMTLVMLAYSTVFARWAGWAVMPRNYMLAGSHMLNIGAQGNQLRRCLAYQLETGGEKAKKEIKMLAAKAAAAVRTSPLPSPLPSPAQGTSARQICGACCARTVARARAATSCTRCSKARY